MNWFTLAKLFPQIHLSASEDGDMASLGVNLSSIISPCRSARGLHLILQAPRDELSTRINIYTFFRQELTLEAFLENALRSHSLVLQVFVGAFAALAAMTLLSAVMGWAAPTLVYPHCLPCLLSQQYFIGPQGKPSPTRLKTTLADDNNFWYDQCKYDPRKESAIGNAQP